MILKLDLKAWLGFPLGQHVLKIYRGSAVQLQVMKQVWQQACAPALVRGSGAVAVDAFHCHPKIGGPLRVQREDRRACRLITMP
jgi:hypothetical protein